MRKSQQTPLKTPIEPSDQKTSPNVSAEELEEIFEFFLEFENLPKGFIPVSFEKSMEPNKKPVEYMFRKRPIFRLIEKNHRKFCKAFSQSPPQTFNRRIPNRIHLIWLRQTHQKKSN